jgi:hypothetical protein
MDGRTAAVFPASASLGSVLRVGGAVLSGLGGLKNLRLRIVELCQQGGTQAGRRERAGSSRCPCLEAIVLAPLADVVGPSDPNDWGRQEA